MKEKLSKTEAKDEVKEFFSEIKQKSPAQVKKIKRIAMRYKISLKENRKLFCKKCLTPYHFPKIRIKNKMKIVECDGCGKISRWKVK